MEVVFLTFVVSFVASGISGFGGGGGGFIMTPYYIWIGLSPQQAVATSKFGGIGVAGGAITAFHGHGLVSRRFIVPLLIINLVCALIAARFLPKINPSALQVAMGIGLIALSPTLFITRQRLQPGPRSRRSIAIGYAVCVIVLMLQAMLSSGLATLFLLALMFFFGLDALQANATKRVAQAAQIGLLAILLLVQGLVAIGHGVATAAGSFLGCHLGSKYAIKRGARFVKVFLAVTMVISGILLIILPANG